MYAVIKTGGKQYKVASGDVIRVEKLAGEAGERVTLEEVLMMGDENGATVGTPLVEGASVSAEVVAHAKGDKILVFKKKRRKNYRRTTGHRQDLTVLRITGIQPSGAEKKAEAAAETKPAKPAKAEAASEPAQKPAKKKAEKAPGEKGATPAAKEAEGKREAKPAAKKKAAAKATKEKS